MTYIITAEIDGLTYQVASDVPDEELEGELQHLARRHEYKNVTRFDIKFGSAAPSQPKEICDEHT